MARVAPQIPRGAVVSRSAAAYLRASTKKQHLSCDDQLQAIEAYCAREGLQLVRVFRDDGVSGTHGRGRRAAWDELLDFVEAGHLAGGVVVVWSMDRWSRDFRAGLLAAWTVGDFQVELHTTDSGRVDLDSVEGQLMGTLKLALAAQESRERGRRVRERKAQHLAAGHWPTRPPYGYSLEGERGRKVLVPCAGEVETVLRIYELYDSGLSFGLVAAQLNSDGRRSRAGRPWSPDSVQRILAGWSYGGISRSKDGSAQPVACKTFVPRDLWERCRQRAESKGGRRMKRPKYALSGLVICGACGRRMRVHSWPTRSGGIRRGYRCPGRDSRECDNPTIPRVEILETSVLAWWRGMADSADLAEIVAETIEQEHAEAIAAASARRPLDLELRELDAQEIRLVDAIRQTGLSPIIAGELERVRRRRADVAELVRAAGSVIMPIDFQAAKAELYKVLRSIDSPALLRDWLDEIVVYDYRVIERGTNRERTKNERGTKTKVSRTASVRGFGREGLLEI